MATLQVNTGRAIITNLISGIGGTVPRYVGWGTGVGTTAASDVDLFAPGVEARVNGTVTRVSTTVTNDTVQVNATITATAAKTVTNAGAFDASTGGSLWVKGDFTGVALSIGDAIAFVIKCPYA